MGSLRNGLKRGRKKETKATGKDPKAEEIREFITGSLSGEEPISGEWPQGKKLNISGKSLIIRYSLLAAAVVIGAVFLIRSLITTGDPQKLFTRYYEPFNSVSAVTRGTGTDGNLDF